MQTEKILSASMTYKIHIEMTFNHGVLGSSPSALTKNFVG